jgi:hypothetical protein
MTAAEFELKSPFSPPFSKGDLSLRNSNPSLEKRGKGRFLTENVAGNYSTNF